MKVTFKYVGQGDSIILEWHQNGMDKIAIIDCHKVGKSNPILDYLMEASYDEIEFVVLSHPHTDHYSGFPDLFKFCLSEKIKINFFYQTIDKIGTDYWKFFEVDNTSLGQLDSVLALAHQLHEENLLEFGYPTYGHQIPLDNGNYIKFLAPHHDEIMECQKIMNFEHDKKKRSKAANYLSTVLKIRLGDDIILLTSDAEKNVFDRILNRHIEIIEDKRLLLCQAPHHGSYNNYEDTFWSTITNHSKSPAVASAGENRRYKHPHYETLSAFYKNDRVS